MAIGLPVLLPLSAGIPKFTMPTFLRPGNRLAFAALQDDACHLKSLPPTAEAVGPFIIEKNLLM